MTRLRFAALLGLGLFLSACGGGGNGGIGSGTIGNTQQTGPNAILNGATAATSTSHWASTQCRVQVQLTGDHGFWSIVLDNTGRTSSGNFSWSVGPNPNSVTVNGGSGLGGFLWVAALGNVTGSTSSQRFTAGVTVQPNSQYLGICTFVLCKENCHSQVARSSSCTLQMFGGIVHRGLIAMSGSSDSVAALLRQKHAPRFDERNQHGVFSHRDSQLLREKKPNISSPTLQINSSVSS
jgi:hypothetical protein